MNSQQPQNDYQQPTLPVEIIAIGMITPIGANAMMTSASVRSDVSAYQESKVLNKNYKPMTMALVPEDALAELDEELKDQGLTSRQQRLLCLATPAIQQLEEKIKSAVPLMFCGPEKLPGRRSVVSDKFLKQFVIQSKSKIDLEHSYVFAQGRSSGLYALEAAMQLLESGRHNQVLIGGVDSYFDLSLLTTLDAEDRVLAEGVMDGFAPGEGAAFLLLKLADAASKVKIFPPGLADEPGHRYSTEPYKGEGLAKAVTDAFSHSSSNSVETVFASFNGEHFNAKEWGVASIRNQQNISSDFDIVHPADCYGDIGAATGPVLMALAAIGLVNNYYKAPALVWTSSEIQQRGAVYISK